MGGGKGSEPKKVRKPIVLKSDLSILDFGVADVTPITTFQANEFSTDANASASITHDANASVTFAEIFPEIVQEISIAPTAASANLLDANQSSAFINIDLGLNDAD